MTDYSELKRLAGEVASTKTMTIDDERLWYRPSTGEAVLELFIERDQLKAENEALRKDAKRYRWLRDSPDDLDLSSADNMEEIDALIDAAMSKER
ncbi:hypothetical protein [Pseudomonas chlororaphis]|uniref:hypothetical protein n=1 Tax=Pseudomonas chlororaphis TaxID=587753 RepID=UPI0015DD64D1|nr:hypothetical protein [Pseudomonas chlororaphis]QLL11752.1 hypothetical protein H0I86_22365 [Pseudomonas chlororaphis subsp. aurantiaca]